MPLITVTSPHSTSKADTGRIMRHVIYATLPALVVMTWAFGLGNLLNVLWCIFLAVALEALCLKMRGKPIPFFPNSSRIEYSSSMFRVSPTMPLSD